MQGNSQFTCPNFKENRKITFRLKIVKLDEQFSQASDEFDEELVVELLEFESKKLIIRFYLSSTTTT